MMQMWLSAFTFSRSPPRFFVSGVLSYLLGNKVSLD